MQMWSEGDSYEIRSEFLLHDDPLSKRCLLRGQEKDHEKEDSRASLLLAGRPVLPADKSQPGIALS